MRARSEGALKEAQERAGCVTASPIASHHPRADHDVGDVMMAVAYLTILPLAIYHAKDEARNHEHAQRLEAALPSASQADTFARTWAAMWESHGRNASRLFLSYDQYHDTAESLNAHELNAWLKDLGWAHRALRAALARVAIHAMDSDGDGVVNENELSVSVGLFNCLFMETNRSSATMQLRTIIRDIWARVHTAGPSVHLEAFVDGLEWVGQSCGEELRSWWGSGWTTRLEQMERALDPVQHELAHQNRWVCAARLPDRFLSHVGKDATGSLRADHLAIRTALKLGGVSSLLVRHLLSKAIIFWLDQGARDGKLEAGELADDAMRLCRVYAAIRARGTSLAAVLRSLLLGPPDGLSVTALQEALTTADSAHLPADVLKAARSRATDGPVSAAELGALAEAYVHLMPAAALLASTPYRSSTTSSSDPEKMMHAYTAALSAARGEADGAPEAAHPWQEDPHLTLIANQDDYGMVEADGTVWIVLFIATLAPSAETRWFQQMAAAWTGPHLHFGLVHSSATRLNLHKTRLGSLIKSWTGAADRGFRPGGTPIGMWAYTKLSTAPEYVPVATEQRQSVATIDGAHELISEALHAARCSVSRSHARAHAAHGSRWHKASSTPKEELR